jgi:hypothetical protein
MAMAHLFGIFLFVLAIASSTMNGHLSDSLAGTIDLVVKSFEWFGNLTIFCGRVVRAVFLPPYAGREFVHQFDELGSKSLPLVLWWHSPGRRPAWFLRSPRGTTLFVSEPNHFFPPSSFSRSSGERSDHHIGDFVFRLRLFQDRTVAGGAFEKREPTHRLRMPALLTALSERAQSGLHR